jgi:hypothetical protein
MSSKFDELLTDRQKFHCGCVTDVTSKEVKHRINHVVNNDLDIARGLRGEYR